MRRLAFILPILLVPVSPAIAQQDFSDATITPVRITEGLHMLSGPGGNIGVSSGPDGIFLIDDQYAPVTEKVRAAIATFNPGTIRFVLNTHWHGDHTGGNENLGQAGAIIVAQDNVRVRMSTEQFLEAFNQRVPASPQGALPVITFSDAVTFYLNGEEVHAFHVDPAHTDGDAVVQFRRQNVLHTGDVFFNGFYPFIDMSSGGSLDGMIAAAERLLTLANDSTKIIPGHGPLASRADLVAYRDMLAAIGQKIRAAVRQGQTLAQVQQARPTADYDVKWGNGFLKPDQFVEMLYASLKKTSGR